MKSKNKDKYRFKYGMNMLRLAKKVIDEKRLGREIDIKAISDASGINYSTLHYIASGEHSPNINTLYALANFFNIENVGKLLLELTKNIEK